MSNNQNNDNLVMQFMELTGCKLNEAEFYLEAENYEISAAIDMYYASTDNNPNHENQSNYEPKSKKPKLVPLKNDQLIANNNNFTNASNTAHLFGAKHHWHSANQSKNLTLANLFAPPDKIMFKGGYNDARYFSKIKNKYLLVNIQAPREFDSHQLNRDVWKNEQIIEIITKNFIFWQCEKETNDGITYINLYNIKRKLPHIAIIDPITGQKCKQWTGFIPPQILYSDLALFLVDNPLPTFDINTNILSSSSLEKTTINTNTIITESKKDKSIDINIASDLSDNDNEKNKELKIKNMIPLDEEPKQGDNVLTIQLILPDGKKLKRNFLLTDTIHHVYTFALHHATNENFDLYTSFPRKMLNKNDTTTVLQADLKNAVIRMTNK